MTEYVLDTSGGIVIAVVPVPEASSYGAALIAGSGGLLSAKHARRIGEALIAAADRAEATGGPS